MANKILILGNGFDIDLGLKTRYSDFANSPIWDSLMVNSYALDQDLLGTLKTAKETEAWFDIEKTMNDYVRALPLGNLTNESGKTKCARFEKRNVQKSGKTKRSKNFAHTTL